MSPIRWTRRPLTSGLSGWRTGAFTISSRGALQRTTAGTRGSNSPTAAAEGAECSTAGRTSPGRSLFRIQTGTKQAYARWRNCGNRKTNKAWQGAGNRTLFLYTAGQRNIPARQDITPLWKWILQGNFNPLCTGTYNFSLSAPYLWRFHFCHPPPKHSRTAQAAARKPVRSAHRAAGMAYRVRATPTAPK